jgi:hypothetical protein
MEGSRPTDQFQRGLSADFADYTDGSGSDKAEGKRQEARPRTGGTGRSQMSEARSQKAEVRKRLNENDLAATMTKDWS